LATEEQVMVSFLLGRLLNALFSLLGLSLLTYLLIYLAPADPAQVIAAQRIGKPPNAEQVAWVRREYGLDQPLPVQYARWLGRVLRGDFGYSIRTGNRVLDEVQSALRYSLTLAAVTLLFVLLVGMASGVWAALHSASASDELLRLLALVSVSIPEFWLAFLLISLFAVQLHWLPSFGAKSGLHLILPMLALGLGQAARLSRLTRTLLLNELHQEYIRTAHGKGLPPVWVVLRHVLPNAALPFITVLAFQFAALASGALIIETLFTWPGLGSYYITAVDYRDLPVIQTMVLLFAVLIISINLLADLSYGWFDPRVRLS
jgi:ABC-type dipeptide/oligopeptide/nickel transport system permease component